ncbi:MAG TPA: hypothetical protein VEQ40_09670 [Pyrinomonadaceae bacterium]|nr:hypothetical protein [Pyrinomonadaceae bacterium]
MPNIDITVDADLQKMFELPACADIQLPQPSPIKITLPTGGTLNAFADISKGVPTDCSMVLSLMLQIAPLLASMDCLLKILKLLGPLVDVIKGLPFPPVKAIKDFIKAAVDLAPCIALPTGAPLIPFVKDILCLILKVMQCLVGQLKTIVGVMGGLSLQLEAAQGSGNSELITTLQCAQENANISAQHLTSAIEPVGALLDLVGPMLALTGQDPIKLPAMGSAADVEGLNQLVVTLEGVMEAITTVTDALGGC